MNNYNHKEIESKWREIWKKNNLYQTPDKIDDKPNFYALVEFPYPSGNLHIGHWYAFAVPDIFVRMKRMQGYNVLFPIGFDAFGLPAENAAIKNGINPRDWTYGNIAYMEKQLESMGNSFDWSRKVITADPEYYKWTQWLFLKLFEKGLAYKKKASVNWCPKDNTVLANEQVVSGKCERCGTEVVQKDLEQWFFKTTAYAEQLLSGLDNLKWPESIKEAQRNWIGKSEGAEVEFQINPTPKGEEVPKFYKTDKTTGVVSVFTTRPDTLFGVTYLVVAPEHSWFIQEISNSKSQITNKSEIQNYINKTKQKTEIERTSESREKTGVKIEGITAINPANGEEVPIFVADYVLGNYGTGAVMAVPAHDDRDFEFAKKYDLPSINVISPYPVNPAVSVIIPMEHNFNTTEAFDKKTEKILNGNEVWTGPGLLRNSGQFNGMESDVARQKITEKFGEKVVKYKLRDWLLSRQRYWGCPIPVVYDPEGNIHPIPEEHLPWLLPEDVKDFAPKGESPIATSEELKKRVEKIFGKGWTPEFDTMDTFVDSSWYFLAYCISENLKSQSSISKQFQNSEIQNKLKKWMPVNRYSGGAEHTNMHLLYSRFFHKALFDLGLVNENEPFLDRMNRGLILGPDGQKMSKSKGNVVDPDEQVERVGSDTVKMYLAFIGPYNEVGQYPWDLGGVAGIRRFLEKVWKIAHKIQSDNITPKPHLPPDTPVSRAGNLRGGAEQSETGELNSKIEAQLHKTIKKVTEDIKNYKFNTAISAMMILLSEIEKITTHSKMSKSDFDIFETFLKLLAPFAPHMTEEIWSRFAEASRDKSQIGDKKSIHLEKWPDYDPKKIVEENVTIVVQINGKVRAQFEAEVGISENNAKQKALTLPETQKWLSDKEIKKIIFVPNKIVNFVVA